MFEMAGMTSVYATNKLDRCFRDVTWLRSTRSAGWRD